MSSKKATLKKLFEIFITFFRIGSFTFGGGYAMIPLIEREVVTNKKWVKEEDIVDVFAVSQSIPGAVAVNTSTFVGYKIAGKLGAFVAVMGVVLPSFFIIIFIATFFSKFQDNAIVQRAFLGIRSGIIGLILMAAIKIGKVAIIDKLTAAITIITTLLLFFANIHPVITIIAGALIGLLIYFIYPKKMHQILKQKEEDQHDIH